MGNVEGIWGIFSEEKGGKDERMEGCGVGGQRFYSYLCRRRIIRGRIVCGRIVRRSR